MAWSDPFGHAQGKRIPASQFLNRAVGAGFAFCEASLGREHRRHRDRLATADQLGRRVPRRVRGSGSVHLSAVAVASASRSCHFRHRCVRPQPVTTGSTRGAPEGDRAAGLTRLHRENRRGVRALPAQPRRITFSGRHPRVLAGERQRARSTARATCTRRWAPSRVWRAFKPSTAPVRSRRTWSTPTRWKPQTMPSGSSTPPRRWPESTAGSPVSCRSRSPTTPAAPSTCTSTLAWR